MAERTAEDVKLRPIPGDVVIDDGDRELTVTAWDTPTGIVDFTLATGGGGWCRIRFWQRGATTAEVIHIAQPKEKTKQ